MYVLFVLPTLIVSYGRNNKSAWCTSSFADTSNLGLIIFLGAGKYICQIACFLKNLNACFSVTFASLDNRLIAD